MKTNQISLLLPIILVGYAALAVQLHSPVETPAATTIASPLWKKDNVEFIIGPANANGSEPRVKEDVTNGHASAQPLPAKVELLARLCEPATATEPNGAAWRMGIPGTPYNATKTEV